MKSRMFALAVLLFTVEGRSQAFYDWVGQGFWDGRSYEGYSAYSSAQIAYLISSFRGPDNATLTDSDPGTCGDAPTGLNQFCQFSTSYFVQSSGATPTITGFMRSFGYGYWLAAPTSQRLEVCVNDCMTRRSIPPWEVALFPRSRMRVLLRKEAGGERR
jgi:hypothetical protein